MPLSSTNLVPELNYWVNLKIISSTLNKHQIPIPVTIDSSVLPQKSFIELLFNEDYAYSEYYYNFTENTSRHLWPYFARTRLLIYPTSAKYYECSETGTNLFGLQSDDLTLLNALLYYRTSDSTSELIITDSTSTTLIDNILYATYDNLATNLAKLIFVYLYLKVNDICASEYNTANSIASSTNILELSFEAFVVNEIFEHISDQGS